MEQPQRFKRLIVMNTALAVGQDPGPGFTEWKGYVAANPDFDIPGLMKRAVPGITDEEATVYGSPFPSSEYRGGARMFPEIVPIRPDMAGAEISRRAAPA